MRVLPLDVAHFQLLGINEVVAGARCLAAFVEYQQAKQWQGADSKGYEALVGRNFGKAGATGFEQALSVVILKTFVAGKLIGGVDDGYFGRVDLECAFWASADEQRYIGYSSSGSLGRGHLFPRRFWRAGVR